jgi:hypothetical protein
MVGICVWQPRAAPTTDEARRKRTQARRKRRTACRRRHAEAKAAQKKQREARAEQREQALQQEEQKGDAGAAADEKPRRLVQAFALAPLHGQRLTFIRIDKTVLQRLLQVRGATYSTEVRVHHFLRAELVRRLEQQHSACFTMLTDGVSVRLLVERASAAMPYFHWPLAAPAAAVPAAPAAPASPAAAAAPAAGQQSSSSSAASDDDEVDGDDDGDDDEEDGESFERRAGLKVRWPRRPKARKRGSDNSFLHAKHGLYSRVGWIASAREAGSISADQSANLMACLLSPWQDGYNPEAELPLIAEEHLVGRAIKHNGKVLPITVCDPGRKEILAWSQYKPPLDGSDKPLRDCWSTRSQRKEQRAASAATPPAAPGVSASLTAQHMQKITQRPVRIGPALSDDNQRRVEAMRLKRLHLQRRVAGQEPLLSRGAYYAMIGATSAKQHDDEAKRLSAPGRAAAAAEVQLSQHSLHAHDVKSYREAVSALLQALPVLRAHYSSRNARRRRFEALQAKASALAALVRELALDASTIIIIGAARAVCDHTRC